MEVAITMVLMVGAGLLGKSLYLLLHVDVGLHPNHLALVGTSWGSGRYEADEQVRVLDHRLERQVGAIPGVQSVALTMAAPLDSDWGTGSFHIAGRPNHGETNEVYQRPVSVSYLKTVEARLVRGRDFLDDDDAS